MDLLRRLVAYVLSFRKGDWSVDDYPVRYGRQSGTSRSRGETVPLPAWVARVAGWPGMAGTGETREEALRSLAESLQAYRAHHGALPRPGTHVPIQLAPIELLSRNVELAREFFPPILGYEFDDCLITDGSSVWDFPVEYSKEDLARKVLLVFGTGIGELAEEGNIAAILDRIAAQRRGPTAIP